MVRKCYQDCFILQLILQQNETWPTTIATYNNNNSKRSDCLFKATFKDRFTSFSLHLATPHQRIPSTVSQLSVPHFAGCDHDQGERERGWRDWKERTAAEDLKIAYNYFGQECIEGGVSISSILFSTLYSWFGPFHWMNGWKRAKVKWAEVRTQSFPTSSFSNRFTLPLLANFLSIMWETGRGGGGGETKTIGLMLMLAITTFL